MTKKTDKGNKKVTKVTPDEQALGAAQQSQRAEPSRRSVVTGAGLVAGAGMLAGNVMPVGANAYDKGNDAVRVDELCELDCAENVALRSFFRRLGAPHLVEERVLPTLAATESSIFVAVRDRPWPPWGHGSRNIISMIQVHEVSKRNFGMSPVYIRPEEAANIGLRSALYKEVLESLAQRGSVDVSYLLIEGAVATERTIRFFGFQRTDDLVQTEQAKYYFFRAPARKLLEQLGLAKTSVPELLAHQFSDEILQRNVFFQGILDWARHRELIPIDGGSFDASLPGGVPPSPPTANVAIGNLEQVVTPRNRKLE